VIEDELNQLKLNVLRADSCKLEWQVYSPHRLWTHDQWRMTSNPYSPSSSSITYICQFGGGKKLLVTYGQALAKREIGDSTGVLYALRHIVSTGPVTAPKRNGGRCL